MIVRNFLKHLGIGVAIVVILTACNDEQAAQAPSPPPKPNVGAQALRPQTVTLTAELPGRTSAHLVSQVRPRVGGIVRSRNFEEGSDVKAGDILYTLDPAPFEAAYRNAEAALQRANGSVPGARARLDRYRNLTALSVVSQQDLDDAQTAMLQVEADVASASAALETARINLEYTNIRAPIDGWIDGSSVTPGALVLADQPTALATIRQLDLINVDVVQSSSNLLRLKKAVAEESIRTNGDFVTVELLLEDGSRYAYPGRLQFSASSVSPTAGTVTLRAIFPNPDRLLMPGMYVRAVVEEGFRENTFLLPQRAVSRNARGEAVAKFVDADSRVAERVIDVERSIGNNWLVYRGITDGDRLVVDGLQGAENGREVLVTAVRIDDRTGAVVAETDSGEPPSEQADTRRVAPDASRIVTQ